MLWTIAVILFILWLLGLFAFHAGAIIHLLLVVAIIVVLWRIITGRKPVVEPKDNRKDRPPWRSFLCGV